MIPSDKMSSHSFLRRSHSRFQKLIPCAVLQKSLSDNAGRRFFARKMYRISASCGKLFPETLVFRPAGDDFSARNTYPDAKTTQKRRLGTPFSFISLKKQVLCLTYYLFFRLKIPYENASHVNLSLNSLCISNSSKAPSKWILYTVLELLT